MGVPARIQGLRDNIEHFFGRACLNARDSKRRPIVIQNGFKRDFRELLDEFDKESAETSRTKRAAAPLNPMAEEFTAKQPHLAARSAVPCLQRRAVALNPMAEEFVPCAAATSSEPPAPKPSTS